MEKKFYHLESNGDYYDSLVNPTPGATYRKAMNFNLDAMIESGLVVDFYGAHSNCFKISPTMILEALENPDDGYRSYYHTTVIVEDPGGFFDQPIARVTLVQEKSGTADHYKLVDTVDGHVWLTFGTSYLDDYYPSFVFDYAPKITDLNNLNSI